MSAKLMGQVWDLDLPHHEQSVLLALADHADHMGRNAHPGVELLAWKTGYSERQVQRILHALEAHRIIVRSGNTAGGRGRVGVWACGRLRHPPRKRTLQTRLRGSGRAEG